MTLPPLVSVCILAFNRKDEVRTTLGLVRRLQYPALEVIVVDNGSTDGTGDMLAREFSDVRGIRCGTNEGISGWNAGFAAAKGSLILALDDDSAPEPDALTTAVDRMLQSGRTGIVAMRVMDAEGVDETAVLHRDHPLDFIGCGVLIRTDVVRAVGGFSPWIFLYSHEIEFAMRVRAAGYELVYEPRAVVRHRKASSHRGVRSSRGFQERRFYHSAVNALVILLLRFPLGEVWLRCLRIVAGRTAFAFYHGKFFLPFGCWYAAVRTFFRWRRREHVLPGETRKEYGYGSFAGGFFFDGTVGFRRPLRRMTQ